MKNSMKKQDVEKVFQSKNSFATSFFIVRWRENSLEKSRVAFAFSRKSGSAVLRNRFKRRLRELIRLFPFAKAFDFVFLTRKPLTQLTDLLWKKELAKLRTLCERLNQQICPASS